MLDVEHAVENPVVEPGLAELVSVQHRPDPLPPLLEEVQECVVGLLGGEPVEPVEDPGGAVDAEPALARPHTQAQQPADVVEVGGGAALHRLLELPARHHLAFADQLLVGEVLLLSAQPFAEVVGLALLRAGQKLGLGRARTLVAEVLGDRGHRLLGHQPEGRELAAGDRHEPLDAVALGVVEQRMRARDVARSGVGCLGVLEQRTHAGPHPHGARLAEAGHELLAVIEHRVDLGLVNRVVIGIFGVNIGGADHAHRPDRHDDVAVGRHLTAVDARVHEPVVHRDHDPPAR